MGKLRPLLILLVFVLLIAAVLRFENQRREERLHKTSRNKAPEFFLDQSLTTYYGEDGKIQYQVNSDHLDYYKPEDNARLEKAYFIFYNRDGLTWHARSDTALVSNRNDDIQLKGNVRIWQPDRHLEISTHSLLLSDSHSIAETDDPIEMKSPSGHLKCIGMKLDINAEKLQFFSQVSSQYQSIPKPIKKPAKKSARKNKPLPTGRREK